VLSGLRKDILVAITPTKIYLLKQSYSNGSGLSSRHYRSSVLSCKAPGSTMLTSMNRIAHLTTETAVAPSNGVGRDITYPSPLTAVRRDRP
jgi:hypothetical protein